MISLVQSNSGLHCCLNKLLQTEVDFKQLERAESETRNLLGRLESLSTDSVVKSVGWARKKSDKVVGDEVAQSGDNLESVRDLVDSQSILINKDKLKEFWERKMELDIKVNQAETGSSAAIKGFARQSKARHLNEVVQQEEAKLLSTEDENNNSNINGQSKATKQTEPDWDNPDKSEWRSFSPNIEPTMKVVADSALAVAAEPSQRKKVDLKVASDLEGSSISEASQLMSIDPTLCHSNVCDALEPRQNVANSTESHLVAGSKMDGQPANDLTHLGQTLAATVMMDERDESEEQTAQEEFSSSNSSFGPMSISVASTLAPAPATSTRTLIRTQDAAASMRNSKAKEREQQQHQSQQPTSLIMSSDDEQTSTLSGSVQTVITKLEQITIKSDCSSRGANWNSSSSFDGEIEQTFDSGASSTILSSSSAQQDDGKINENAKEEPSDEPSCVGVAFESLHFDTQVKSSRHELVEADVLFGVQGQQRRKPETNFKGDQREEQPEQEASSAKRSLLSNSAREVRSVCNFIAGAISDATRQVDYLTDKQLQQSPPVGQHQKQQDEQRADLQWDSPAGSVGSAHPGKTTEPSSSIERAMFVQEPNSYQDDNLSTLEASRSESPRADLSSIFEANVRREIERFESNVSSSSRKLTGQANKLLNNNGLTERRIAEEIRSFNEREMELKQRYESRQTFSGGANSEREGAQRPECGSTTNSSCSSSLNGQQQQQRQIQSSGHAKHETIARFGKTFQLPRAANKAAQSVQQVNTKCQQTGGSIKLTSSLTGNKSSQSSISMHKFIASGGRRFVVTSSTAVSTSANGNSSNNNVNGKSSPLSKSMSNLAIVGSNSSSHSQTRQQSKLTPKVVDYKAVDSLNRKEMPNVKPGLTRMVIETFSRMSDEAAKKTDNNNNNKQPPARLSGQQAGLGGNKSWSAAGWQKHSNGFAANTKNGALSTNSSANSNSSSSGNNGYNDDDDDGKPTVDNQQAAPIS